jgi:lipid-A-disaccharide synthase-like uncharacterized protein
MNENMNKFDEIKTLNKPQVPVWFWVISILTLLWFLMDTSAFVFRVFMLESMVSKMPENQQNLYINMPSWVNVVFALEVFGGLLGCVGLILKKKLALLLFNISIVGVLIQTFYIFFLSEAISIMGTPAIIMPLIAIIIGTGIIILTKFALFKRWIN